MYSTLVTHEMLVNILYPCLDGWQALSCWAVSQALLSQSPYAWLPPLPQRAIKTGDRDLPSAFSWHLCSMPGECTKVFQRDPHMKTQSIYCHKYGVSNCGNWEASQQDLAEFHLCLNILKQNENKGWSFGAAALDFTAKASTFLPEPIKNR